MDDGVSRRNKQLKPWEGCNEIVDGNYGKRIDQNWFRNQLQDILKRRNDKNELFEPTTEFRI